MKGRILTYVLVCLALATTACISPGGSDDPTTKPNHLNSNPFPIAGDISLDSQPNLTKDATVNEDTALLEHDGAVQETVGPEDSSPYECEPFTQEECISVCGTKGTRKCIKEWGPCVVPEVCNGIDDDCNGIVDDGSDGPPTEEVCDGLDNDCDGEVDEDLFVECGCHGVISSKVACIDGEYPACPEPQSATQLVEIPSLDPNCPWDQGDNLGVTGGTVAARVEQEVPFSFPEDRLICSLSLSGASDDFYYDDTIVIALNGVVLISSTDIMDNFETQNGLPLYSWDAIIGESIGGSGPACLAGATACQMPGTQQNGEVSLEFDQETSELLIQAGDGVDHLFTAIVTGDDNPPSDCHHNGLTIQVDYTFVPK